MNIVRGHLKLRNLRALAMSSILTVMTAAPVLADETPATPIVPSNSLAGNYLAARIAATDKDTSNAVTFYRQAIALDPDNVDLKLKAFLNFVANGDFEEGVVTGRDIIKAGNEPEVVNIILSVDDIRRKNWAGAERNLTKDWRSALDRLMAGLVYSWTKVGQKQNKEAMKLVDDLKGPAWFDLFAQYHGGLIALNTGDTKGAIKRLDVAFKNRAGGQAANETYSHVISALAYAYFKDENLKQAKATLQEGLRLRPQSPVYLKALAALNEGKAPDFKIVNSQRGAAEVFLNLGTAINKEGGQQFARIYMQLARTLAPKDDAVLSELAQVLDAEGLMVEANKLFEDIDEQSPYYRIARLEIALNLDELENLEAAKAEMESLLKSGPDDLVTYLSYGAVLARHDKFGDAAAVYQRVIDRIDKPERLHWNLFYRQGIAYERTKQWPKAEAAFKKSLELLPDQPSVLNYLGYSWIDMNINLEEGLEMIRKAVSLRPNDGYMVDSLGWAFYRLKRFDESVVQMERAVELRPGDPTINDHLGDAYWKAGRKLEATFQWQHALALDPPEGDAPRIKAKLKSGLDDVEQKELAEEKNPDKG